MQGKTLKSTAISIIGFEHIQIQHNIHQSPPPHRGYSQKFQDDVSTVTKPDVLLVLASLDLKLILGNWAGSVGSNTQQGTCYG